MYIITKGSTRIKYQIGVAFISLLDIDPFLFNQMPRGLELKNCEVFK